MRYQVPYLGKIGVSNQRYRIQGHLLYRIYKLSPMTRVKYNRQKTLARSISHVDFKIFDCNFSRVPSVK